MLLFLTTNMAAVTTRANQQYYIFIFIYLFVIQYFLTFYIVYLGHFRKYL